MGSPPLFVAIQNEKPPTSIKPGGGPFPQASESYAGRYKPASRVLVGYAEIDGLRPNYLLVKERLRRL
jgi:hypothetical protein